MGKIRDNVRHNLKYYLSLNQISQKEFAKKLSVSPSAVTNWISGSNAPDIDMIAKICEILSISINDLFGVPESSQYTKEEIQIIIQYRKKTDLHQAVKILLEVES